MWEYAQAEGYLKKTPSESDQQLLGTKAFANNAHCVMVSEKRFDSHANLQYCSNEAKTMFYCSTRLCG